MGQAGSRCRHGFTQSWRHRLTMADPRGGARGRSPPPLDWGQKKFIGRPKNTHICKPPFACQNVLKLTYSKSRISKFSGGGPPDPPLQGDGREGKGRRGRGKGSEGGRGRIGKEGRDGRGQGREGGEEWGWGGEGRGARHAPLETSSRSAPFVSRRTSRPAVDFDTVSDSLH